MRNTLLLTAAALLACGDDAPPALVVGPVSYTEDQLLGLSDERRRTLADLTAFGLAVADSTHMELGAPLLRRWEEDRLLDYLAAEVTLEKNGVSDAVLEARYLTDPDYELTVRHILFFSERWRPAAHRADAEAKAERALEALRAGADFAETAARLSEEPGAESRQGLLTPGREGAWVDEFWTAASALDEGEISAVTETQYGYHILRLERREVVPFSEARSDVALDVADRIEDPRAVLEAFLGDQPALTVDDAGVREALAEAADPQTVLARWDGGRVTLGDFRTYAAAQPTSWEGGGLGHDGDAFRASVEALARRRQALTAAADRGLAVSPAGVEQIRRAWDDRVYRWAATLGFRYGLPPEQVGAAAMSALSDTGQNATITRNEIGDRAPLLRAAYDVVLSPVTPGETAGTLQP